MKKKILLLTVLLLSMCHPLFAKTRLADILLRSSAGDYAVLSYNGNQVIFVVKETDNQSAIVEEIRYTSPFRPPQNWKNIVNSKKGHPKIRIFRVSKDLVECFSLSEKLCDLKKINSSPLFATLLTLDFDKIPEDKLRRINGGSGSIWHPKIISEENLEPGDIEALEAYWPRDNSFLSEKRIEIRLTATDISPFPVWIEIGEQLKIRSLGIGKKLITPFQYKFQMDNDQSTTAEEYNHDLSVETVKESSK
ncbi:MAG: hypothetical protein RSB82_04205 [Victivallaceae bacterium]